MAKQRAEERRREWHKEQKEKHKREVQEAYERGIEEGRRLAMEKMGRVGNPKNAKSSGYLADMEKIAGESE